ncbi:MAG: DegT/DnrJ/EryC1/StrS family aminotransferase [Ignavibacteria bacterium]|jgi:dTDP-4-amino-4,6-dideoxygalactose transaminase
MRTINVTRTYLPSLTEYQKYLKVIWKNKWITNHGPLVKQLEKKLIKQMGVKHLFFVANGTIALQIAIRALELNKEIITTPFSYVATTSSIVWEGCKPIFVDIDQSTLCMDPNLIQKSITSDTQAILATHVYGYPCDIEAIQSIAQRNNLRVIYDAAHGFGVRYKGKSLLSYGDISTVSFHATKLFHTAEGGAVVTNDDDLAHKISYLRNFGHKGQEDFWGLGINGKNSELHAAIGLCILPKIKNIINQRKKASHYYDKYLEESGLIRQTLRKGTNYNYSYYPVLFKSEEQLIAVRDSLNKQNIFPRRYFYPSLNTLNYIKLIECPITDDISKRVLCLPLYAGLSQKDIRLITEIILKNI